MGLYLSSLPALAMAVVVITVAALPPMISLPSSTYTLRVFFGSVIVVMLPMLNTQMKEEFWEKMGAHG